MQKIVNFTFVTPFFNFNSAGFSILKTPPKLAEPHGMARPSSVIATKAPLLLAMDVTSFKQYELFYYILFEY